jgi:hypothetical protein
MGTQPEVRRQNDAERATKIGCDGTSEARGSPKNCKKAKLEGIPHLVGDSILTKTSCKVYLHRN